MLNMLSLGKSPKKEIQVQYRGANWLIPNKPISDIVVLHSPNKNIKSITLTKHDIQFIKQGWR